MSEDAISRLNELLEAERAGVETLAWLSQQESMQDMLNDLKEIFIPTTFTNESIFGSNTH